MNRSKDCKRFGYRACKYRDYEIMKEATRAIPKYNEGNTTILYLPLPEEIDEICSVCNKYTPRGEHICTEN